MLPQPGFPELLYRHTLNQLINHGGDYFPVGQFLRADIRKHYRCFDCLLDANSWKLHGLLDIGVYKVLLALKDDPRVKSFYEEVLGRLIEQNKKSGTDLLQTLKTILVIGPLTYTPTFCAQR